MFNLYSLPCTGGNALSHKWEGPLLQRLVMSLVVCCRSLDVDLYNVIDSLHVIIAGLVLWSVEAFPIFKHRYHFLWMDSRVGDFPCREYLPAGHSICPLCDTAKEIKIILWSQLL